MPTIAERYRGFIVDIDGVLIRGREPIPGAVAALRTLREHARTLFLTNNSTRSTRQLVAHLTDAGFDVAPLDVMTSGTIAARHLLTLAGPARVWPIGEDGLLEELAAAGHTFVSDPSDAMWVVAGMDRNIDYHGLSQALKALQAGAQLLATNTDATYPMPDGDIPGAGAVIGALTGMGFPPSAVAGKPEPLAFSSAVARLGLPEAEVLAVGDRLDTDIAGGQRAGLDTALVLTGVTRRHDVAVSTVRPTWVADSLHELVFGDPAGLASQPTGRG
jgi:HAD superfamily hydrolase (TIGR01457 family)